MTALSSPAVPVGSRWIMIAALSVSAFVLIGICAVSVGLLLNPLMTEFKWPNSATSGIATAYALASLLGGPLIGLLVDRFGGRPVLLAGVTVTALGFLSLNLCNTLPEFYTAFMVIGVGYGGCFFLAMVTLVANGMADRKNLAMGIVACAGSLGAALFSIVVGGWMSHLGWRTTAMIQAGLIAATLPTALIFVKDFGPAPIELAEPDRPAARGLSLAVFLAPFFLLTTAASAFAAFGMGGINYHIVPILQKAGLSSERANEILGASWLLSAVGSLISGAIANRFGAMAILAISVLLGAVGTLGLAAVGMGSPMVGLTAAGVFVFLWGATANATNSFFPILLVDRFGSLHLGLLVGAQTALMGITSSFAPMVTGALYDASHTYQTAILVSAVTPLIGVALLLISAKAKAAPAIITATNL